MTYFRNLLKAIFNQPQEQTEENLDIKPMQMPGDFTITGNRHEDKGFGALLDERTEEEKQRDYKFEEMVTTAAPVTWIEKVEAAWRKFPIFDQNGSGSCVAQTMAKLLGVLFWLRYGEYVHFSATHIYQRRANRHLGAGMAGVDAFKIAQQGVTLEVLAPSQQMTDTEMDTFPVEQHAKLVGEQFRIPNYITITNPTIDTIASIIQQTQKAVMVWFYFSDGLTPKEWPKKVPTIEHPDLSIVGPSTSRHSVSAVDFTMYKGKKALVIEDSWGVDSGYSGRRIVTEDFFKARNFFAAYPINFYFADNSHPVEVKPVHTFSRTLLWSADYKIDAEVVKLQDCLKDDGSFPVNIESSGYYGNITAEAVLKFQRKWKVADEAELTELQGRRVGGKTIDKLNALYSTP